MALPAPGSAIMQRMARGDSRRNTDALAEKMEEMKGVLNRLLFKVSTNTKDSADHLAKIKGQAMKIRKGMGDLEAAAELQLDELVAIKEGLPGFEGGDDDGPGGEGPGDKPDGEKVDDESLLKEIKENTKVTADKVGELLDAVKEGQEDVLVSPGQPTDTGPGGGQPAAQPEGKEENDIKKGFNKLIGGYIGIIAGLFLGWIKALGVVLKGIVKVFTGFGKFFKGVFSGKAAGALTKVFKAIGNFMKMLGSIFGRIFGFLKPIVQVAGSVASTIAKIFAPLLVLFGIFEGIKGAIEGFLNTEGSILDKIIGGLMGAIGGVFDFLVSAPLNLLKNIVAWIGGMLGFDNFKEKLDGFEFSFEGLMNAIGSALEGIKNWFLSGLSKIGIPPFEFTIPIVGTKVKFDGFFPFAGLAPKPKQEEPPEDTVSDDVDAVQERRSGAEKIANEAEKVANVDPSELVKVPNPGISGLGDEVIVSKEPNKDGKYTVKTPDGFIMVEDKEGTIASVIKEGGAELSQQQQAEIGTASAITAATGALSDVIMQNNQSSPSMTSSSVVRSDNSVKSNQSTSIFYGDQGNSLGSRAGTMLPS